MKRLFCPPCDKFVDTGVFLFEDLDVEVVLKANRLIASGKATEIKGSVIDLDTPTKVEVNKILSEVLVTENIDGDVVCPDCREVVLIAGKELSDLGTKETKEERLRRLSLNPEVPRSLNALTPEFIKKQIQSLDDQIASEKALSKKDITTTFNIARYYISTDEGKIWNEVSLSTYASMEREAGFIPEVMKGPIATASFNQNGIMGKVVNPKEAR